MSLIENGTNKYSNYNYEIDSNITNKIKEDEAKMDFEKAVTKAKAGVYCFECLGLWSHI
jgi:hypothetical protein